MSQFLKKVYEKFLILLDKICRKFCDFKERISKGIYELTNKKFIKNEKSEAVESSENSVSNDDFSEKEILEKNNRGALSFLLNFLDVFASLLFIASIVVILKPKLIVRHGIYLEQFDQFKIVGLSIYTLLKSIVAFYSKKVLKRSLPLILLVISILAYFLLSYNLIMKPDSYKFFVAVSSILCILSYFAFEYSCGYRTKTVFRKVCSIIILGFIIYIMANFSIYSRRQCLMESADIFLEEIVKFFASF
ncbi:MAG: hypothetical protein K6E78_06885 [Treponema sp.]|nr:hypothetical protein [Treponema sp.]